MNKVMKVLANGFGVAILLLCTHVTHARDVKSMYSIEDALQSPIAQEILSDDIQFYFGEGNHPDIKRDFGNFQSNKKSNGVGRSNERVCERAFLSAMKSLRDRARTEGGDAVVNIISYYRRNKKSSATEFECGSGSIMSGVTLRGDVVKLK